MLGWVAATNSFGIEPGFLFMVQFFGSFLIFGLLVGCNTMPTKKAGFLMLPTGEKNKVAKANYHLHNYYDGGFCFPVFKKTGALYILPFTAVLVVLLALPMLYLRFRITQSTK